MNFFLEILAIKMTNLGLIDFVRFTVQKLKRPEVTRLKSYFTPLNTGTSKRFLQILRFLKGF